MIGQCLLTYELADNTRLRCLYCQQPTSRREGKSSTSRINDDQPTNQLSFDRVQSAADDGM